MEPSNFLNPFVLGYLLIVIGAQAGLAFWRRRETERRQARRRKVGLPDEVILDTKVRLATIRHEASIEAVVLLVTLLVTPFLLWLAAGIWAPSVRSELGILFAAVLFWVLFTSSDVGKTFLGGVAFRTLVAFNPPFQVGDQVTLRGQGGTVTEIGLFYVRLATSAGDLVSIPTASLWGETLVSANAGDRSSICVMPFFLAPFATRQQQQSAENALWDAIQASTFFDFGKPMQISVKQTGDAIVLTAKAHVANTYNDSMFMSEVASVFLRWAADEKIPLASTRWREVRKEDD